MAPKKKCDEQRPRCARCTERGLECTYGTVKPRQRKKRDSQSGLAHVPQTGDGSVSDHEQWPDDAADDAPGEVSESVCTSPVESRPDTTSLFNFSSHEGDSVPSPTGSRVYEYDTETDEDQARDIVRRNSNASVMSHARSLRPDLAMIAPSPVGSPTLDFCIPAFSEFSDRPNRRALVDHFCNVLSHLIVFREESGNPFQQLVLPLSFKSTPVMNAIYALASAHLEYRGVDNAEKSIYFHNQAIQGLTRLIENQGKGNKNELLAAIMLLVYYEVLVQRGRTSIVDGHLRGALTIMCSSQDSSPAGLFLERAFRFYDVITALSLGTPPLSTAPAAGCLLPYPPLDATPASPLSNVDTLLGMATGLWPIMHRLSNLLSVKVELEKALRANQSSKGAVLRSEFEATSQAIETALAQWEPCLPPNIIIHDGVLRSIEEGEMQERPRLQSILHNALAYRHSAFVYLYRTIYGYLPSHQSVQKHAHAALSHCVETTVHGGPMGALLWPLFVAACEAISAEDRGLAQKAFVEIELRQGMTNIEQAWRIIREVWNRLDLMNNASVYGKNTDLWRRVSAEMGVNIIFG
ncbi:Uu.00g077130.m01.CDS01 [Anthostomella pinea]|uniref:Uu.00g077130.m01.CDS01 n=1 Tax=Anthostomella pinea TaxID=933095 RepID=A0AAI8VX72_9PEZI|nr:Uu.00g077130.m01.CDS01 [Anthostomella pinea]